MLREPKFKFKNSHQKYYCINTSTKKNKTQNTKQQQHEHNILLLFSIKPYPQALKYYMNTFSGPKLNEEATEPIRKLIPYQHPVQKQETNN